MFADVLICLRFFSRLPVPATSRETALGAGGLATAAAMVPLAGLVIGLFPAATLLAASSLGLTPWVAAALSVTVVVIVTGALHEDALADCADGFGGGRTRDRKLEIMRDSCIGAFGGCAIGLSLLLRTSALTAICARSPGLAALVLLATASVSRAASLIPLVLLRPARDDGMGAAARPDGPKLMVALVLALAASCVPLLAGAGPGQTLAAPVASMTAALAMMALAFRMIGGQTGDVAGATQQVAEIAMLVVFSASH